MFEVRIFIPQIMEKEFVAHYKSIREASFKLRLTYYFLYNCWTEKHDNQFANFFKITYIGENEKKLNFDRERKNMKTALNASPRTETEVCQILEKMSEENKNQTILNNNITISRPRHLLT